MGGFRRTYYRGMAWFWSRVARCHNRLSAKATARAIRCHFNARRK